MHNVRLGILIESNRESLHYYLRMGLVELIAEVDRLSPVEQERLAAHLKIKKQMQDAELREELTRKINDKNPANWFTLEEAEKRLFPES